VDHRDVGRYWNANAEAWTKLSRAGYDVYRDLVNTPAFFDSLPSIDGLRILDLGCGEGHNTRLLADRGAEVTGADIAEEFIAHARNAEIQEPRGITFEVASAVELPFADRAFDAVTSFMALMDVPEIERALAEVHRVLEPGGFFQFSISHPCFDMPNRRSVKDEKGKRIGVVVGDYFNRGQGFVEEWLFSAAPPAATAGLRPFKTPRFVHTLSEWINMLVAAGFTIEHCVEPYVADAVIAKYPRAEKWRVVPDAIHFRVRRPDAPIFVRVVTPR
jgi:ubiquinone/menaquinone biosynthesis C-methylase UbiE